MRTAPQGHLPGNITGYEDFRDFLSIAEDRGFLRRVTKSVDRSWEPACLAKWMFQALPNDDRFGLLFDNVEGCDFPAGTNKSRVKSRESRARKIRGFLDHTLVLFYFFTLLPLNCAMTDAPSPKIFAPYKEIDRL